MFSPEKKHYRKLIYSLRDLPSIIAGTVLCSEFPFGKNTYHIETSQVIISANQLTGYYMIDFLLKAIFQQTILILRRLFRHSSEIYQPCPQSFVPL